MATATSETQKLSPRFSAPSATVSGIFMDAPTTCHPTPVVPVTKVEVPTVVPKVLSLPADWTVLDLPGTCPPLDPVLPPKQITIPAKITSLPADDYVFQIGDHPRVYVRKKLALLDTDYPSLDNPGRAQKLFDGLPQNYREALPRQKFTTPGNFKQEFEIIHKRLSPNQTCPPKVSP
jgi:hypothetical protein